MNVNIDEYTLVQPRVFHTYQNQTVIIKPLYHHFDPEGSYEVSVVPRYFFFSDNRTAPIEAFTIMATNHTIQFDYLFKEEQEYVIAARPIDGKNPQHYILTSVYAVDDDLYVLYVLKGDLHMHTNYSDGIETPHHRVMTARKNGFDFLAVTDHNNFEGSLAAIDFVKKLRLNMIALHGEEVHALHCPMHILSLGAKETVVPKVTAPTEELIQRRQKLLEKYENEIPEDVSKDAFIAAIDVFEQIRLAGGMSVLCHIYWDVVDWYHKKRFGAPQQLVDALVREPRFDAFELTSGAPKNDLSANYLQDAYYREKLPKEYPIIGITDTHCTSKNDENIFGKNYTIVFAKEKTETAIIDAIRNYRSVCIDGVGENIVLRGSLRLCKYSKFLIKYYFSHHDALLFEEGSTIERVLKFGKQYINNINLSAQNTKYELNINCQGIRFE